MHLSPLFIATARGNVAEAKRLLSRGQPVDWREATTGATALHAAAELGHTALVEVFVRVQANVNLQECNGCTPLYVASQNGRVEVVRALARAQADIDLPTLTGATPLIIAAENGHLDVVAILTASGANVDFQRRTGSTALFVAAQNGSHTVVTALIKSSANVDIRHSKGCSPLYIACQAGHVKVVELLLAAHSEVNLPDVNGCTPLYIASQQGHRKIVELLMRADADVNVQRCTGETALFIASQNGHAPTVMALAGGDGQADVNLPNASGESPLFAASRHGRYNAAIVLIGAGVNVNQTQSQGCSPLLIASEFGHHRIADALIRAGANLNLATSPGTGGASPLIMAAQKGHCKVAEALIKAGANLDGCCRDGTTALYFAAQNGHLSVAEALLRVGVNADVQESEGLTPMFIAAQNGHHKIVFALLQAQANPELPRNTGETPLWIASQEGHAPAVDVLVRAQSGLDTHQCAGYFPLYVAAQSGHQAVVDLLLAARADANLRLPDDGTTALYIASQQGHYMVAQSLTRAHPIDPNAQMTDGSSPLYAACQDGHLRVVQTLIEAGADANLRRINGVTPLIIAAQNGHAQIVRALLEAPADPDLQNNIGSTPLYMAARLGRLDVVKLLLGGQADANLQAATGQAPLHAAAEADRADIVDLLLGAGANVGARTIANETALDLASRMGHREVLARLLDLAELQPKALDLGTMLLRFCRLGNSKEALRVMKQFAAACGSSAEDAAFSTLSQVCKAVLSDCLQTVETQCRMKSQQKPASSAGELNESDVSEQLHVAFLRAGFSHERAALQACLSDVLQDIVRRRRDKDDIFVVGSYSEGWGNSLERLNGRTAPDSDIDVTEFYAGLLFHIRGRCCCIDLDTVQTVPYENGHVKWHGFTSSPARPKMGSALRPAVDIVPAFRCCCYPPGIHLPETKVAPGSQHLLRELRQELTGTDNHHSCHLVTAAPPGEDGRQLRVSTTFLERRFMRQLVDLQGHLFILLKYVIKRILSDEVTGLKTYHGKTLLFHMVEATPGADWEPRNLAELTRRALLWLISSLQNDVTASNECMRHYFMPDAILYLKNGSSKRDIVGAIKRTIDRLPTILSDFRDTLKPLDDCSIDFYFHPFLVLPHLLYSAEPSQILKADYHEIYDIVKDLLVKLSDDGQCSLTDLMDTLERLPDCAATARECLKMVALLKHQMANQATIVAEDSCHLVVNKGVPCPQAATKEFVWHHILSTDSAWKFCFVFDYCPKFAYLPQLMQAIFLVELPNYNTYYYVNFDAIIKCLRLELTDCNPASTVAAGWFNELVQTDNPDYLELLMVLNYCPDLSTVAHLVFLHSKQIEVSTQLTESVIRRAQQSPELKEACILETLKQVKLKLTSSPTCVFQADIK